MAKLTQAQVRRNIAIRNKMKAKASQTPATEPKTPFQPSIVVESFDKSGYTPNGGLTKGDAPTPFVTFKADDKRSVMAFGSLAAAVQNADQPLQVVMSYGRGAAKIVALVVEDGSMVNEAGEPYELAA